MAVTLQGCPYTDDEMLAIFMYSDRSESVAVFIAEYWRMMLSYKVNSPHLLSFIVL